MAFSVHKQVLEGWLFLGNVQELGSRLTNAYMSAVSASCAQTVRSVLLTQPALAARALSGATMHDLTRGVPSDLFRTCLARVPCTPSEQRPPSPRALIPLSGYTGA